MVCSEKELDLSDSHEGNLVLPQDAPVGMPLVDYMGDVVFDYDVKGAFGHLQCIYGAAREVAALTGRPLRRRGDDAAGTERRSRYRPKPISQRSASKPPTSACVIRPR